VDLGNPHEITALAETTLSLIGSDSPLAITPPPGRSLGPDGPTSQMQPPSSD
jgi:hypothetical protein